MACLEAGRWPLETMLQIELVGFLESSTKLLNYVDHGRQLFDAIDSAADPR
jgi:hypothetical protein